MRGIIRLAHVTFFLGLVALVAALTFATREGRLLASNIERLVHHYHHVYLYRQGKQLPGTPDLEQLPTRLAAKNVKAGSPLFIRIFKQESELELWLHNGTRFVHFATYPICYWSGALGPKRKEGDRQSPEGFYSVSAGQLNPRSAYHRSFNLGYPNRFDRSHARTGSFLMVHGNCVSIGCYAMTDPVIDEIWHLVTSALKNGQKRFAVHAFPFRMTQDNLRWHANPKWDAFWGDLKQGHDLFEQAHVPPRISVCNKRYVATAGTPGSIGDEILKDHCPEKITQR